MAVPRKGTQKAVRTCTFVERGHIRIRIDVNERTRYEATWKGINTRMFHHGLSSNRL